MPAAETVLRKGITLWGATATGKTTFLAALYTALLDQDTGWRLRGEDRASTENLVKLTAKLAEDGVFPEATVGVQDYNWSLVGTAPRAVKEWHWYGPRRLDKHVVIPLNLVDAAGEVSDAGAASMAARLPSGLSTTWRTAPESFSSTTRSGSSSRATRSGTPSAC